MVWGESGPGKGVGSSRTVVRGQAGPGEGLYSGTRQRLKGILGQVKGKNCSDAELCSKGACEGVCSGTHLLSKGTVGQVKG